MTKETEQRTGMQPATPAPALTPFEEMERWLEESVPRGWMRRWGWPSWGELTRPMERFAPRVDVIDRDDEVIVRAEVAGVRKEDLDISLTDSALTIKGRARREDKKEEGDYYRCEIASGAFARTVGLPSAVDSEKAKAAFVDGIVEVKIPKLSKTRRRRIEVE